MSAQALRWIGVTLIVAISLLRCCVVFLPQLAFESDPAAGEVVVSTLAMGGSLLLDCIVLIGCAVALLGEWRSGRGLDPLLLVLALAPLPVIAWHGRHDAGNAWLGTTWFAAACACATLAHLARERMMRIAITAALIAVAAPLLTRGAVQMTWEHDATVAAYQQNKAAFLQARGLDADSPAARIYERRLMHREPLGWFPSTNLFGSVMGASAVLFSGLAIFAFRAYRAKLLQSGAWFLMAALAVACAIALKFTTSMGAMLAMAAGVMTLVLIGVARKRRQADSSDFTGQTRGYLPRWLGALVLIMILGATFGVIVRGAVLPEGFLGEKSLLFRWHYLQAAVGMVNDSPLAGVGPSGFQLQYMMHRVPRNPEEVQSAHAMFTDWVATLGVLGGAWVALIITLIVRLGVGTADGPADATGAGMRGIARFIIAVAMFALVPATIIEWPTLDASDIFLRGLALLGYAGLAMLVAGLLSMMSDGAMRGVSVAAVAVLLVHGQIEMTFHQGGTVVWMMCMVGLLGGAMSVRTRIANSVSAVVGAAIMLATAGWTLWAHAIPAIAQERAMLDAAKLLDPVRQNPSSAEIALRQRPLAADRLIQAYAAWPMSNLPINAAVEQLLQAAEGTSSAGGTGAPIGLLMRSEELADRAVADHDSPSSIALAMNAHAALAGVTDDPEQWTRTIALGRRMTEIDPHGVGAWKRLGDVLWAAGAKAEAAQAYQTALTNSNNFALDPLKQLSPERRAELQMRIDETR